MGHDLSSEQLAFLKDAEFVAHYRVYQRLWASQTEIILPSNVGYFISYAEDSGKGFAYAIFASKRKKNIIVSFRGTHNFESMLRDLELAPGVDSFNQFAGVFLEALKQTIKVISGENKESVSLSFSGHSLGGVDAQNAVVKILEALYHDKLQQEESVLIAALEFEDMQMDGPASQIYEANAVHVKKANFLREISERDQATSELSRISQISLITFNAPGTTVFQKKSCRFYFTKLKRQRPRNKLSLLLGPYCRRSCTTIRASKTFQR